MLKQRRNSCKEMVPLTKAMRNISEQCNVLTTVLVIIKLLNLKYADSKVTF